MIARFRLEEWVQRASRASVAVLRAPAGFGKTIIMLQLLERLERLGRATAWLTLDRGDNDLGRFLAGLLASLQRIDPSLDPTAFDRESFETESVLLNVLDWVASYPEPFALFLDDGEVVRNPEVHAVLRQLSQELPPRGLLVLAARELPDLGLGRLRVSGRLLEIGPEDLRFASGEAALFLRSARGLPLADDEVLLIHRKAEGWAAGLQLAALALAGRDDKMALIDSISGSFVEISEYLAEEVLSRQPEDVRDFLMRTSILERLSGPLCDAVLGGTGGYRMLSYLERANLFLMPLDEERRWYRYHYLFAKFLRGRLEHDRPEAPRDLHQRAADWFSARGAPDEAANHALSAGDTDRAASLVADCALELVRAGRLRTVKDWVERLPDEAVDRHPQLRIALCWAFAFRHRYAEASALFERIQRSLDPQTVDPASMDDLRALEPLLVSMTDRVGDCLRVAQSNLEKCSDRASFARGVLQLICACHLLEVGDYPAAQRFLRACQRDNARTGSALSAVYGECFSGALHLMQGRLGEALDHYRSAYARVKGVLPGYSVIGAVAAIFLAEALYERNELEEAERLLLECRDLFSECMPPDVMMIGYVTLARLRLVRRDAGGAAALHEEAERIARQRGLPRFAATIHLEQARVALGRGEVAAAQAASDREEDRAVWEEFEGWGRLANDVETPVVSALRRMVGKGEAAGALPRLRSELERAEVSLRSRRALGIRVLLAEALAATGDRRGALRVLREALHHGSREGFIRPFADAGSGVLSLLRDLREACEAAEGGDGYAAYLDRILAAAGEISAPPIEAVKGEAWPFEALTSREVEIIRMASAGYSNKALAERLFVSVPTVKYHLRNINVKLRSANRTEAIAKARRYGLIG
ncbi:MAG: hypothetical protein HY900_01840 [Deltaproteobacteria bacterium]|nr:hypothetical protein [Deltaproteobacteria bacterium]